MLNDDDRIFDVLLIFHKPSIHSLEGKYFLKTLKAGAPCIVRKEEGFPNDPDRKEG